MAKKAAGGSASERLDTLIAHWRKHDDPRTQPWSGFPEARAVFEADPATKAALVAEILARIDAPAGGFPARETLVEMAGRVLLQPPASEPALALAADHLAAAADAPEMGRLIYLVQYQVDKLAAGVGLDGPTRDAAGRLAGRIRAAIEGGHDWPVVLFEGERQGWVRRLELARTDGLCRHVEPGEAWSDVVLNEMEALPAGPSRSAWVALFRHARDLPRSGKPAGKWLGHARALVDRIGPDAFEAAVVRWFPLVDRPRPAPSGPDEAGLILGKHATVLRGLAWACTGSPNKDVARSLARLAFSSYRKVPGIGPRLVALGNAAVAVLGDLPGFEPVGQLAVLKARVKSAPARKEIEKAFDAAARREALPREAVEELGVPHYGMDGVGRRVEEFGDHRATMIADSEGVSIAWSKADGTPLKSAPASIRKDHAEAWKELQATARDAGMMLTARAEALDASYLARPSWPIDAWRGRHLGHPLVGALARRLIWDFAEGGPGRGGLPRDGQLVGSDGRPIDPPGPSATVSLWHPIGRPIEEVLAWRDLLGRLEVRQPFKQAHREVYLLTDAERATGAYSNRFAAHILKQHQFHALCAARGWKDRLRLSVNDPGPPATRLLPEWDLRAEFWVETIGDEVNEASAHLYLATDQVRFYPIDAAWEVEDRPIPLGEVPPLALSEVMRDVDLFVGVASVGNDPTWSDGGAGGRDRDYWERFNFGSLTATARTRKAALEAIVPRLRIADRCGFTDRFLVVRGDRRTYKIHLGSGNILMEPNDHYLCIVPERAEPTMTAGRVFLPFEGDAVLSVVLSKALMLADDRKIEDPTINSQIGRPR